MLIRLSRDPFSYRYLREFPKQQTANKDDPMLRGQSFLEVFSP